MRVILLLFLIPLLAVVSAQSDWWQHAVFYQIYPRSFKDSNNDGIGDLQGILQKLDHLKEAGITAAWLSPIYASPQVDGGYDISNFTDVNPEYGTLDDFDQLIARAKELGLKVVMDFVPNHSSDQHEWFIRSENREEGFEDFYIWKDGNADGSPPNNWLSVFKYSAWQWSEKRQQYYFHQFASQQPDLNFRNPAVVQAMKDVLIFWMDRGVDGFRIDAIPHLFETEELLDEPLSNNPNVESWEYDYLDHIYTKDQPETFDMVYQFRDLVDEYSASHGGETRVLMTEAYTSLENTLRYYGDGDRKGAHFSFNFQLITSVNRQSPAEDFVKEVDNWMAMMSDKYTANWVLGNHDQHRVASRYGSKNVDGFNMFVAMLPGVQVTYNGEEIGMENGEVTFEQGQDPGACNGNEEDFNSTSRDFERTPFHWDDSINAGFNEGAEPWLPVSSKYLTNNLAAQKSDPNSHYSIYKQVVQLRNDPVFEMGQYTIKALSEYVIGLYRSLEGSKGYLLVFNKAREELVVDLTEFLPNVAEQMEVVISGSVSTKAAGDVVDSKAVYVGPHEAFIAIEL